MKRLSSCFFLTVILIAGEAFAIDAEKSGSVSDSLKAAAVDEFKAEQYAEAVSLLEKAAELNT